MGIFAWFKSKCFINYNYRISIFDYAMDNSHIEMELPLTKMNPTFNISLSVNPFQLACKAYITNITEIYKSKFLQNPNSLLLILKREILPSLEKIKFFNFFPNKYESDVIFVILRHWEFQCQVTLHLKISFFNYSYVPHPLESSITRTSY